MRAVKIVVYILLVLVATGSNMHAQQTPVQSHYMFNGLLLNPAYAGTKEYVSSAMMYRKQWVGLDGAPSTQTLSIHGPLKSKKVGLGLYLLKDKIGVTSETDLYGSFSYQLPMPDGKFSFGMQFGMNYFKSDLVNLRYWDPQDQVFIYNSYSNVLPNVGVGAYYYEPLFYAGFSVPSLISYNKNERFSVKSDTVIYQYNRRYLLTAGYVIETERDFKLKPSFLIKYEKGGPMQFDLNMNVLINDIFWVGASYRSSDAIVALIEYQVNRKFRIGYSYDYTLNKLRTYESGSHEIMIGYDFGYDVLKMKTPRYF
ncbi:MAG: type IX secretion system membrane protein PorP/SprF [Bacteroidota bacterium]